jgi:hypothetical protein
MEEAEFQLGRRRPVRGAIVANLKPESAGFPSKARLLIWKDIGFNEVLDRTIVEFFIEVVIGPFHCGHPPIRQETPNCC